MLGRKRRGDRERSLVDARVGARETLARSVPRAPPRDFRRDFQRASLPVRVAPVRGRGGGGGDASPGKPNEATLWVCARDARDVPPPRYASASAALFVLRLGAGAPLAGRVRRLRGRHPERGGGARCARSRSSLVRVGGDQARAFANPRLVPPRALPLLVLVEGEAFEGSAAERRATEAAIASAVAGAVASAASGNVENATPSVPVRVDSIGGSITADAGSEARGRRLESSGRGGTTRSPKG